MSSLERLNAAFEQHRAGNLPLAERLYREILAESPDWADAHHMLGALYVQARRPAEAAVAIQRAIELNPHNADYYSHLGAAYGALGRHADAVEQLRRAVRLNPQSASAHYNLGTALRNADRLEEAVASFRHAIAANPNAAEAHYNLANSLRDLQQPEAAEAGYREAIRLRPDYFKATVNLGNLLSGMKRREEALALLAGVIAAHPRNPRAYLNLGCVLRDAQRFGEALQALQTSLTLDATVAETHAAIGTVYQAHADLERAAQHYQQALVLNPELADARFSYGTCLLRQGDFERGFAEYEWRWRCKSFSTRRFDRPRWNGEPLSGRTILLHAEQGLGDTFHFVRFAANIQARGARVIVECQPVLMRLLERVAGIDQLVAAGSPLPAHDFQLPLLSVPHALGLSSDAFWGGPYLTAEPERVARWRERLAELPGLRVGVCWRGNPDNLFDSQRSFGLKRLHPASQVPGVTLVNLQKDSAAERAAHPDVSLVDLGEDVDAAAPFLDTAAVITQLDLVLSADTSIAHLAGGLGAPVWLPLSAHGDWRWLSSREESPWYPTIRLFRQSEFNRWDDVFARISTELAALAARRA